MLPNAQTHRESERETHTCTNAHTWWLFCTILTINGRKIALAPFKYFFCIMRRFMYKRKIEVNVSFRRKIYFIGLSAVRPKMLMNVLQFSIYFISASQTLCTVLSVSLFSPVSFFLARKFLAINKIIWNISNNGQKVSRIHHHKAQGTRRYTTTLMKAEEPEIWWY